MGRRGPAWAGVGWHGLALAWATLAALAAPGLQNMPVFQVTVLRGENASAKSLHSVVQSLESDKVKLELKVKNLELQLKENKRQLSSSSGETRATWPRDRKGPSPRPPEGRWVLSF